MKAGDLVKFIPGHTGFNPYPNMIGIVTGKDIAPWGHCLGVFIFWSARDYTALMIGDKLEVVCESR